MSIKGDSLGVKVQDYQNDKVTVTELYNGYIEVNKVIEEGVFRKIVFVKPVISAGNDIDFLPGTEQDKLGRWMGSFYDAIDNLFGIKAKNIRSLHEIYRAIILS